MRKAGAALLLTREKPKGLPMDGDAGQGCNLAIQSEQLHNLSPVMQVWAEGCTISCMLIGFASWSNATCLSSAGSFSLCPSGHTLLHLQHQIFVRTRETTYLAGRQAQESTQIFRMDETRNGDSLTRGRRRDSDQKHRSR